MENQKFANPAPLGLLGFGMTTVLLNLCNAGIIPMTVVIIAMGLALGGLAQIIAGIMELKAGNTFGGTAFTSYGCFWWSLVIILVLPVSQKPTGASMGFYLLLWAIYTAFMFVGTLKHHIITRIVFGTLTILFLLLAVGDFTGSTVVKHIAGWEGVLCGLSAIYSAGGQIVNGEYKKDIFKL